VASLSKNKKGRFAIQFIDVNRKRRTITVGAVTKRQAQTVQGHVEELVKSRATGGPVDHKTLEWLRGIDARLLGKIEAAGLAGGVVSLTLEQLFARYRRFKRNHSEATATRLKQAERSAIGHFGKGRHIRDITAGAAQEYREHLLERYAEATTRKRCADLKSALTFAISHELLAKNPFEGVAVGSIGSQSEAYVPEADALQVLEHLPSLQWRLLFILSRWGGVRVPSEPAGLMWADIDWALERMVVTSPKTAHQGKPRRLVPIFPEIMPTLRVAFDAAPEGSVAVLPMLDGMTGSSIRKPLLTAIKRAGLVAWPRLWHTLRASRQTDLEKRHPNHVVCAWLGNTPRVAHRHYLRVTDQDFAAASDPNKALHGALQPIAASDGIGQPDAASDGNRPSTAASDTPKVALAGLVPSDVGALRRKGLASKGKRRTAPGAAFPEKGKPSPRCRGRGAE
jgi:integrase